MASGAPPAGGSRVMVKSPPPPFRPPPPLAPPPMAPASPMTQRRLSVGAAFKSSPKGSPNPPPAGFKTASQRPVEQIEDQKIKRFGEARLRSPGPPVPPPPTAAALQSPGLVMNQACFSVANFLESYGSN